MTTLSARQQLELALLEEDLNDTPTPSAWDSDEGQQCIAREAAMVRFIRDEGINPEMFGPRLKGELPHAHFAAWLVQFAGDGFPADSLGGRILTAAGIEFPIVNDDDPIPF